MATLEAIQEKIKRLQAQANALIAKKAQVAVDQIRKLMIEHGLTTEEIEVAAKAKRDSKLLKSSATKAKPSAKTKAKAAATKPQPKYEDKKSGATWSGYGRAPAWIAGAKDRTKFLISAEAAKTEAPETSIVPTVKKVVAKKAAAKKVTAKKAVAKKAAVKAQTAEKVPAKKVATKKAASKKVSAKTAAAEAPAVAPAA